MAETKMKVAVAGLGAMGYGMAQSALRGGHQVWGIDINPEVAQRFVAEGGEPGPVQDVLGAIDVLIVCVLNAVQTEELLFGASGLVAGLRPGAGVMSCATVPPTFAAQMAARCAEAQIHYLDAPISGGAAKSAKGQLSIMAAGSPDAFAALKPVLDSVAETVFDLGPEPGRGSAMKSVNQLLAGVHIATMAEALTFALSQGIEPQTFVDVISQCAGNSWMLENRAPHIVAGDYTPLSAVTIWPKDLGIVSQIAEASGVDTPLTAAALAQFQEAIAMGLGGEDDAAVAKVYAARAGLSLPEPSGEGA